MRIASLLLPLAFAGCAAAPRADPASDAPEPRVGQPPAQRVAVASYADALMRWRDAEDVNAWIGAHFRYDLPRALQLSESQRARSEQRLPIHAPAAFFDAPSGVCVDLSRFAVETLRVVEPAAQARHLVIEFAPVQIQGQTLRRHWVAHFERDGAHYFFGDSKRPGHIAGPYAETADFIRDYAAWRGREIVAFRDAASTERTMRKLVVRQAREPRP